MSSLRDFNPIHWNFRPRTNITGRLASHIAGTESGDVPARVLELAKMAVLDALGCMAAGAFQESGRKLLKFVRSQGGAGECSVVYHGDKVNRYQAALLHGAFCHGWEFDDAMGGGMSCEAVIVPAALAVGEKELREGNRLLGAVVLGWETMCRIASVADDWVPDRRPLHPTSTFGPFGAAAAAGKLLGFDAAEMENALSLCEAQAAGMSQALYAGSELGRLPGGFAASYGVRSAYLARAGLSGARDILEGNMGFYQCVCGLHDDEKTPRYDPEKAIEGFGGKWLIEDAVFKSLPVGEGVAEVIEAIGGLQASAAIRAEDIEEIRISSRRERGGRLDAAIVVPQREDVFGAQRSLAWGVAMALLLGANDIGAYRDNVPPYGRSGGIERLARLVRIVDETNAEPAAPLSRKVAIRLKGGAVREAAIGRPKGDARRNPMHWDDLERKFRKQTDFAEIPSARQDWVIDAVKQLENLDDIGELAKQLAANA